MNTLMVYIIIIIIPIYIYCYCYMINEVFLCIVIVILLLHLVLFTASQWIQATKAFLLGDTEMAQQGGAAVSAAVLVLCCGVVHEVTHQ